MVNIFSKYAKLQSKKLYKYTLKFVNLFYLYFYELKKTINELQS